MQVSTLLNLQKLIAQITKVEENQAVRLAPDLLMWKEGSSYSPEVTNQQFDQLESLLKEQGEKPFYLIDLSLAKRPDPEIIHLVEQRLEPIKDQIRHAAVYTGKNHIIFLGIKFYFIRFRFPSYSAHSNIESALNSFVKHGRQQDH